MRSTLSFVAAIAALAHGAAGHAIFQQLWVNGVDMAGQCVRLPGSNTPVTNVAGAEMRCNVGGARGSKGKCPVQAGQSVTIEMHQQSGVRGCGSEAIGGAHYGPVIAYLSKVADSATADGSAGWFKIYQNGWAPKPGGGAADNDFWGVKDMNACCGKVDVKIPEDIEPGDYLLRGEVIALHSQPAQLYMSCYQLTVEGNGTAKPPTVNFPGAYGARDPGLTFNLHAKQTGYVVPGPPVYAGGVSKTPGSGGCSGGCQATCAVGKGPTGTAIVAAVETAAAGAGGATPGCASVKKVAAWQQCGGAGFANDGCVECPSGYTCKTMNNNYAQCAQG